ncbi:MAG: peptidylprolyl isomerase [Betaproteobacteria bacterium]|jgi:peptidyl-prolyl cis-trans isomerase C|nr:peptidylprolyl isomerase [Betaproteobacteria bacterium]HMV20491.1 peptidylprolyl isomerase [Rhodocyclaceae bacterium]HMW77437.1 peptidylprolyl isomerase [Rhodocyclaceae bacterium]HNE43250.1 peptidylprolyl isomerase [Rhodocyclaceae bacterium]HNM21359.1 peptidylprolyl isomerase [Rhodocyclaceae bacterium]
MLKPSALAALLVAGSLISAPALAEKLVVNGQTIPQSVFDAFAAEQKAQGAADSPELQKAIREELVRREVLSQEAKKKGIDKKPEVAGQIELARQAVLIRAFLADYVKSHPVSEDKLKKDYETIKGNLGSTEFKARHILVEKEDDAKAIIGRLDKGEKFAELAKQSKDPGSKDNGGELNWSSPSSYVKPFGEALGKLKKGEYTKQPVKTDFGYHVIQLDDSRPLNAPPYEQVKPQLQQRANAQMVEELVKELREKAKVN